MTPCQTKRFAGGHFAKSDDQKIELDFIACSLLLVVCLSLHDVMEFSNLTVRKIKFIMTCSGKYRRIV